MVTLSTNWSLQGPDDSDNAEVAVHQYITNNNNKIDIHDHSIASKGLPINTIPSGNLGINVATATNAGLTVSGTLSGNAIQYGALVQPTYNSGGTTLYGLYAQVTTTAAAYTVTTATGQFVATPSKGAGSAITTAYGLYVQAQTQAATNVGLYVEAPSGGATSNIGIRVAGGAPGIQVDAGGLLVKGDPAGVTGYTGLGATTGLGNGANTNLQAPAKGTGSGPATLLANIWVTATIGTQSGWIPFFV